MVSKPEQALPPELYYNDQEAVKYSNNAHIIDTQTRLTERAIEILAIDPVKSPLLLDIGCGSGISGSVLSEHGFEWIGMDVSKHMLNVAAERELDGDVIYADMGDGFGFRPGTFDGAVSISAIQWLCTAETKADNPYKRIHWFFESLYRVMVRGGRCALQFYPHNAEQIELLTNAAMKCGFTGGLIVDYPHSTKAKKYFLMLNAGVSDESAAVLVQPKGVDEMEDEKVEVVGKKDKRSFKGF